MSQEGFEIGTFSQPVKLPEGFDQIDFVKDNGSDSTKSESSESTDTSCRSILVSSKTNKESLRERRDAYGVLIGHQEKKHRIKFRFYIAEEIEVENWKKYYKEPSSCLCNPM